MLLLVVLNDHHTCLFCGEKHDTLNSHLKSLEDSRNHFFSSGIYGLLGENHTAFEYSLMVGEIKAIDFGEHGIPEDAKIIRVDQSNIVRPEEKEEVAKKTATGATDNFLAPFWQTPNDPSKHRYGKRMLVVGAPIQPFVPTDYQVSATISVLVRWISPENIGEFYPLFSALEAYYKGSFPEAVVFASASVERSLFELCDIGLSELVGHGKRKEFLENQCTFSGQINVLSKLICSDKKLGKIPEPLLGQLNRLRNLRNDAAHHGEFRNDVSADEIFKLIGVAIFATHLFRAMRLVIVDGYSKEAEAMMKQTLR